MATLLNAVSVDGEGSSTAVTGPVSVWVSGSLDGGEVYVLAAPSDTPAKFVPLGQIGTLKHPGVYSIDVYGSVYVKAVAKGLGTGASVTVETTA